MREALTVLLVLLAAFGVTPAFAQQVRIEAPAPTAPRPEPGIIADDLQYEMTVPEDGDYYPPGPRVRHDPAFLGPLSVPTETGRAGLAGWTAPNHHVGGQQAGWHEVTGWFALGFAVTWGGPPATKPVAR